MKITLLMQMASTWTMVGVIWFVQVVHYPLFAGVDGPGYRSFMADHTRRTTWVVGPTMLVEAASTVGLLLLAAPGVERWMAWIGVILLGSIWISTGWLQVPRHRELARGFDDVSHRMLVSTNWIRTVGWTLRGLLSVWWLA